MVSGDSSTPIAPIITPCVRRRRVMARVSTPLMPVMSSVCRYSSSVMSLSEWLGRRLCSRTTKPATCTLRDSTSRELMP